MRKGNIDDPQFSPEDLLTILAFSETKDPEDAMGIMNVAMNRLSKPARFGRTLEEVVFSPNQFTGVGTKEWEKAKNKKMTPKEQKIYDQFREIAQGIIMGSISDTTGGADHYYNPAISSPSWGNMPDRYPETYKTDSHRYLKEK